MCGRCYAAACGLAASLWPHMHGRAAFVRADASPEEDAEEEADSAARAAAVDGFFATAGSPRQLAPAFAAQPTAALQHEQLVAAPAGDESPQHACAAVDALHAPMSEHKLSK